MLDDNHLDWMSILIEKNKEASEYVDYVFICNLYGQDPRRENRRMIIAQNHGLFRVKKPSLKVSLLRAMDGDSDEKRFIRASSKILREYKEHNNFPEKSHFACG